MSGNLYQEARALRFAAQCTIQVGDYRNSIDHLHKAKEILAICGMLEGRIDSAIETSRAEVHQLKSEYTEARSIHTHILQHTDHDPIMNAGVLLNIAQIDVMTGATEETVQQNLNEATTLFSTMKNCLGAAYCNIILGDLKLREGDTLLAKHILQDYLNLTWGKQNEVVSFCLERFADRNRWHATECASPWPVVYLAYGQQYKEKLAVYKALLFLEDVFIAKGNYNTAKSLFMVALEGFVYMDVHCNQAQCLLRLGDLANKKGDFSHAAELWMAAHPLFERSSQAKDVARIDARLTELEHNQKALMQLTTLHPPETIFEEQSSEVQNFNIEEAEGAAGHNLLGGNMVSDIIYLSRATNALRGSLCSRHLPAPDPTSSGMSAERGDVYMNNILGEFSTEERQNANQIGCLEVVSHPRELNTNDAVCANTPDVSASFHRVGDA
ncbi:hypothetical protein B0H14DRAFT_2567679 [Mycena olivaceomarginata]|nr:hypothetical protein B0H14DRAFT_2567679 [Mycena olivaceomarginata]